MDELLYLVALAAGIIGGLFIWKYSRTKQRAVNRAIRKSNGNEEEEEE